jgi:hypothetical protein
MALMVVGPINWVRPAGANNSDDGTGTDGIRQAYDAGSGDGCGVVSGELIWQPSFRSVLISGFLLDQPIDGGTTPDCGALETTATFTAYAEGWVMSHVERINNARLEFSAPLPTAPAAIDRMTIRVCRTPTSGSTATPYCGPTVTLRQTN